MTNPYEQQWQAPPPQPSGPHSSTKDMWIGIGVGLGGHALTILIGILGAFVFDSAGDPNETMPFTFLFVAFVAQVVLMLAALIFGIIGASRGDKRGVGLLIGWAIGLIVAPVVGFGVCVALINVVAS